MYGQGPNQSDQPPVPNGNGLATPNAGSFYGNQQRPQQQKPSHNPMNNQMQYQSQRQPQQRLPHQQSYAPQPQHVPTRGEEQGYGYAPPQNARQQSPTQNGFFDASSYGQEYAQDYTQDYAQDYSQEPVHQTQRQPQNYYNPNSQYQNTGNASPPQVNRAPPTYSNAYAPSISTQSSPSNTRVPTPAITRHANDFARLTPAAPSSQIPAQQSSFFNMAPQQFPQQPQQQPQPLHQQQQQPQPQMPGLQGAVPLMLAGMQQMSGGTGGMNAALGAQLINSLAPGAAGYTNELFGQGQNAVRSFMRLPKYYFAVNHRYVLKKLALILMPFTQRMWARQRGMDPGHFEGSGSDGATSYLPPREDVNAPDLYIPLMAFLTYVIMVGFVFGIRNAFQAEVLARYFSKGLGVLTLEVLMIKLGLYLINARPTPWMDVIAYRGYKFVGVVLTMVTGIVVPKLYLPALLYSATAMGLFLMRSHRRIILPRDVDPSHAQDLARRNGFLLFVSVLQYPIYWVLVLDVRS